jgi:PAS domain S-box-containing protein
MTQEKSTVQKSMFLQQKLVLGQNDHSSVTNDQHIESFLDKKIAYFWSILGSLSSVNKGIKVLGNMNVDEPEIGGESFPFPLCIIRTVDQVVVSANKAGLELFGYSLEDLQKQTLWDIVAHIDWDLIAREATRSLPGAEEMDIPSSGLLTFRRSDGSEFVSWFRVRDMPVEDGVVRYRAAVLLEDSMSAQDESLDQELALLKNRNYLSAIAGSAAHEVNSSLVVIEDFIRKLSESPPDDQTVINRALKRLQDVGSQLSLIGNKGQVEISEPNLPGEISNSSVRKGNVLVVDDEPDLSEVIKGLIEAAGYAACSAANTSEALECFKKGAIDCALVDVQLGDELGTDLARNITTMSPSTHVIMMSGFSRHIEKLRLEGEYQFLRKPFAMFDLLEMVEKAVARE